MVIFRLRLERPLEFTLHCIDRLHGSGWRVRGTGDFSADGKDDVLFQHADGSLAVWFMDGSRVIQGQTLNPSQPGGTWKIVAPR